MTKTSRTIERAVFASTAFISAAAFAQTAPSAPDAGSLLQQIERERILELPKRVEPRKEPLPAELKEVPGLSVMVNSFKFAGNTIYTSEELAPLLSEFVGKAASYGDLMRAADTIAEHYRKDNWVVRVYLPAQDVTQGVITIQIVEAVFGGVRPEGEPASRVSFTKVQRYIETQQPVGSLLRNDTIDRGLLLADDLPGVSAVGALVAGQRDGETDLAVRTADEPFTRIDLTADNTGSRSTGAERATAALSLASPFGYGDSVSATAAYTEGSDYLRLAYSAPLGSDGLRVGINTSYLQYEVITDEFKSFDLKGDSQTAGLEVSYPLIRARLKNLYAQATFDHKRFDNKAQGLTSSDYKIDVTALGLYGNLFDSIGGGGSNSFNAFLSSGKPKVSTDINGAVPTNSYTKLRYGLNRQQVISETVSLTVGLTGQHSDDRLDSSERFSLGGAAGVRAYPSGEATGTVGQLVNAELRWILPMGFTTSVFYDWGKVKTKELPSPQGSITLKGGGVSLTWFDPAIGLNVRAILARRDGNNPNPSATGQDQDGSLKKNRFWLTATYSF